MPGMSTLRHINAHLQGGAPVQAAPAAASPDATDTEMISQLQGVAAEHGLDIAGGKVRRTSSRFCLGVEHGDYNGTELFGVGTDRFIWLACAPQRPLPPPPPPTLKKASALPPSSRSRLTARALPHRQAERDGHDQPLQRQLPRRRRRQLQGRRRRRPRASVARGGRAFLGAVPLRRGLRDG